MSSLLSEVIMFIPVDLKPNSDALVIFDYPSFNDAKGTIADSNMKQYFVQHARALGMPITKVSYHSMLDYPLGKTPIKEFFLTKKSEKTSKKYRVNDFYLEQDNGKMYEYLVGSIDAAKPRLIICCSSIALTLFANNLSIDAFRGSMLMWNNIPVLVTYGPMTLYTRPELHLSFKRDLLRATQYLAGLIEWKMPEFNIHYGNFDFTIKFLKKILLTLSSKPFKLSVDIETRVGLISFIGFAVDRRTSLVIPFITWDDKSFWTYEEEVEIVLLCRQILSHVNVRIIGQNFQYDAQYIVKHWAVKPVIWRDTMVEAHVNWTKGQPLSLAFLSSMYCEWYRYWKEDGKDFHKSFQEEKDFHQYALYNGYDTCYTYEVSDMLDKVSAREPREEVRNMQREMQNIVMRPVLRGLRFDKKLQQVWRIEYEKRIQTYKAWFDYIVPDEMVHKGGKAAWYDSPTRMAYFFYNQLGVDIVVDKKTKKPTTSDEALKQIGRGEPILKLLTDMLRSYSSLMQFYTTYLCAKVSSDGYMRTQYMLAGTDTFRLASRKDAFDTGMNLQNISKG